MHTRLHTACLAEELCERMMVNPNTGFVSPTEVAIRISKTKIYYVMTWLCMACNTKYLYRAKARDLHALFTHGHADASVLRMMRMHAIGGQ